MKAGYFTHTNIGPSETFIYDLVKGLNAEKDIDLTFVTGHKKKPIVVDFSLNSIASGYSENNKEWSFRAYKLGQVLGGRGYYFKSEVQSKSAYKALNTNGLDNFDVAYVEYATSGVLLMQYLKEKNIPCVLHVHGYDVTAARNDPEYSKKLFELYKYCSYIVTPSEHLKRLIILQGCEADKIKVIYPFEVSSLINPENWKNRYKNKPAITFLGRLTQKKNPIALLYAFSLVIKEYQDFQLNILGGGDLLNACKIKAKELGIEKYVFFHGVVDRTKAFDFLNNSWIYAQHSVTSNSGDQEGFPVSLAEAAAHALPLVSTIHSGITENIIEGQTGFLVQEYNYEAMAEKIIYLIKNPAIAEKMGKAGRKHIMDICSPGQRVKKIKELLLHASNQKSSNS
ncbi:glycosyltransferase family 4 protein [Zunongwangia sp. F260]|uniref:Glycosyltransferase family 4 protein n=1 Tax=Autumnicola lenta TaxID=3075593 RepID=A0ABU3CM65_9FLAO|nr:glycosyltransferase family 4 protein [Zunongwangia sp. F260]MDT0647439.1 glycosyltransferase family 4 protein [Zunongwangia sp. F260]